MENSPRRPLPLNLSITDLLFGPLNPPTSNLVISGQKMFAQKSPLNSSSSSIPYNVSHALNIHDTTELNGNSEKNPRRSFFRNIVKVFDSVTNIVSKISNFTLALNNTLSVTVVPDQDIISSEYLSKTVSGCNMDSKSSSTFNSMEIESTYDSTSYITQVFTAHVKNLSHENKFQDIDIASDNFYHHSDNYRNLINEQTDIDLAIKESLKHMKNYNIYDNNKSCTDCPKMEDEINDKNMLNSAVTNKDMSETSQKLFIQKKENSQQGKNADFVNNLVEQTEILKMKPKSLKKIRRKFNTVVCSRVKGRHRMQLRKSGASQLKHRKERTKQNIYSTIQEDLNAWEKEQNDSCDEQSSIMSSSDDENMENDDTKTMNEMETEYPILIKSFALADIAICDNKQKYHHQPTVKSLENSKHSSNDLFEGCDNRSRTLSQCSVDSDDSFIIFEEGSERDNNSIVLNEESEKDDDSIILEGESEKDDDSIIFEEGSEKDENSIVFEGESEKDDNSIIFEGDSEKDDSFIIFEGESDKNDDDDDESSSEDDGEEDTENESADGTDESSDSDSDDEKEPPKRLKSALKVRFNLEPTVHTIIEWDRKGPWEQYGRDRERFRNRINGVGDIIGPILSQNHRSSIWDNRFKTMQN